MAVAVVTIPALIGRLGTDRFGVLTLAWILLGYFSLFDLGLGRALTKMVAEQLGLGQERDIPGLVLDHAGAHDGPGPGGGDDDRLDLALAGPGRASRSPARCGPNPAATSCLMAVASPSSSAPRPSAASWRRTSDSASSTSSGPPSGCSP